MKKYKRILAALLAINLTACMMLTDIISVSAGEEYQSIENSNTDSAEITETEESEESEVPDSQDTEIENNDAPANFDDSDGFTSEDSTDSSVLDSSEGSGNADTGFYGSSEEMLNENAMFADDVSETGEDQQESNVNPQADLNGQNNYFQLSQFRNYNSETNTITISSADELILLSNCNPSETKDITINLNITGSSDLTGKINKDTDLSAYITPLNTTSDISDEKMSEEEKLENIVQSEESQETENTTDDNSLNLETDLEQIGDEETSIGETEDVSVQEEPVKAERDYEFMGMGTPEIPFQGKITGQNITLKIKTPFFGGLSSNMTIERTDNTRLTLNWCGDGNEPMIARVYQFDVPLSANAADDTTTKFHELQIAVSSGDNVTAMGTLLGTVKEASGCENQTLIIDDKVVQYTDAAVSVTSAGNAGLVCNTLESGTICLKRYALPNGSYTINSTGAYNESDPSATGNAGGVIGVMKQGTTLDIQSSLKINKTTSESKTTVTTITASGNAGGLIGLMEKNTTIKTSDTVEINLSCPSITGGISAGGIAGTACNATMKGTNALWTIESPTVKGSTADSNAGGFIGHYQLSADDAETDAFPKCIVLNSPIISTTGTNSPNGNSGGYFGYLELTGKGIITYTIGNDNADSPTELTSIHGSDTATGNAYGAIAGKVTSSQIASTLSIQNMKITSTYKNKVTFHGGLIGELGKSGDDSQKVYLTTGNVDLTIKAPYGDGPKSGFGGLVGCLAQGSIMKVHNNVILTTEKDEADAYIWEGGGIVGRAEEKSVLELTGITDLSDAQYSGNLQNMGWLVGFQENALIYAKGDGNGDGWKYIRGKDTKYNKEQVNDIANYGQVIRLKAAENSTSGLSTDFVTVEEATHSVKIKEPSSNWDSDITISSTDDFALLSIAWNSRGVFCSNSAIKSNWKQLQTKKINLNADVNLTGTGITGLSRDTYNDDDVYSGTFDGHNYTIELAVGEPYGYKKDQKDNENLNGGGETCATGSFHAAQGLFAKVSNATIQNVVIAGKMNISNKAGAIAAGGIAAYTLGETTVKNVTVKELILADCANSQSLTVGGLYGSEGGGTLTLSEETYTSAKIELSNVGQYGSYVFAGGVLGQIATRGFKLNINGLKVGGENPNDAGSISTDASNYAYIGGLVGIIKPLTRWDDKNQKNVVDSTLAENHWIEIRSLAFCYYTITAKNAQNICGGLFGSIWSNVGVYFMGSPEEGSSMLTITDSTIDAPKTAKGIGGLVYRSSGIWEIRDQGINMQSLTIHSGGDVGLLVCRGEKGKETISGDNSIELGALYLLTTTYWETSYRLSANENDIQIIQNTNGVFDEFVAHTAESAKKIVDMNTNGVISIATQTSQDNSRVGVDASNSCTTYCNRTAYGKQHTTNGCSRYYYDLDQCLKEASDGTGGSTNNNGWLETPQELVVWSAYQYAYQNIKAHLVEKYDDNNSLLYELPDAKTANGTNKNWWFIGNVSADSKTELDMKKYSYYPVRINLGHVRLKNTEVKFYNLEIETQEKGNKSTQETTDQIHTQHYTMHCGLFYSFQSANGQMEVENVTFSGTVGKINQNASGALIAYIAAGYLNSSNQEKPITITLKTIKLNNLSVYGCEENYAPLLINNIGSYSTLKAEDIQCNYESTQTVVASSLIGNVGNEKAQRINLSFQNIVLPDEKSGIFSHATLLESFAYANSDTTSSAVYNFYSTDDWENDKHTHKVTYGKEITDSAEYAEQQKWYYDEDTYGTEEGLVYDKLNKTFSSDNYLPYVCQKYTADAAKCFHEIKVNQRVIDILNGCGTYAHPYVIQSEKEMKILSEYMSTELPRKDWRVTITKAQNTYHNAASANDATYQFDGTNWVQVENKKNGSDKKDNWQKVTDKNGKEITLERSFMLQYLLNAYYDLQGKEGTLSLSNFGGFGTAKNPFRGVLTSTNNNGTKISLSGEKTCNGIIPYSNGSVVRNLTISYEQTGKTLTYETTQNTKYPLVCFGGVIGCILGGDNIIDNVTVQIDNGWLTLSGDNRHLIQIGGYVGSVCGGGAIFRNMKNAPGLTDKAFSVDSAASVVENAYKSLYVNPYVGRVLDGFAFYESSIEGEGLDNTNKNYKINTLNTSDIGCVTVENNEVTIYGAQGMLVLSAIVNSGAASNGSSTAYSSTENTSYSTSDTTSTYKFAGKSGKVRNASYAKVGSVIDGDEKNYSIADDAAVPGKENLPYLIRKYCSQDAFGISGTSGITIHLDTNKQYDLSSYENGYQGIAARYASNAILNASNDVMSNGLIPELTVLDGKGASVKFNIQVREYQDDDFPAASVGGMFNLLRTGSNSTIQNINIIGDSDTLKSVVSLQYYDAGGAEATSSNSSMFSYVGTGAFAGTLTGISASSSTTAGAATFHSVNIKNVTISGPKNAGGLIGSSIKTEKLDKTAMSEPGVAYLLKGTEGAYSVGIQINNSKYENIKITAPNAAGGFVGYIDNESSSSLSTYTASDNTDDADTVEDAAKIIGDSSVIGKTDNSTIYAGGVFGYVKSDVDINSNTNADDNGKSYADSVIQDTTVFASEFAGGFIGKIAGKVYQINQAIFKKNEKEAKITASKSSASADNQYYAGGIVGAASGSGEDCAIQACEVIDSKIENTLTTKDYFVTGGIVGRAESAKIAITGCEVRKTAITGGKTGGIVGETTVQTNVKNCKVLGTNAEQKNDITGSQTAGGIIGFSTNGKNDIRMEQCTVQYINLTSSSWGCGGVLGDVDWNSTLSTLYLFDCAVEDSVIKGTVNDATAGGFAGDLRGKLAASNLLLSNVELSTTLSNNYKVGMVIGLADSKTVENGSISVAGLSIQNAKAYYNGKETEQLYGVINGDKTVAANMQNISYFAFADYSGAASEKSDGETPPTLFNDEEEVFPYVVTSPYSTLSLYENEDSEQKTLYGDGVSWTKNSSTAADESTTADSNAASDSSVSSGFTVRAEEIWNQKNEDSNGHYPYGNITNTGEDSVKSFDFNSVISTYNKNQTVQQNTGESTVTLGTVSQENMTVKEDFPVVQVTSGNADVVKDYLNIITNGGFSAANNRNAKDSIHVTAAAEVYQYSTQKKGFVKADDSVESAFKVSTDNDTGKITFSTTTDYDNEKGRFTLLTVTFIEKDSDSVEHKYNVFVPVLVRRMLEMDFTATLTYGTDFKSEDYNSSLSNHVLESFGSSITGYLTYAYNSAEETYTDYGWESYINAGGNLMEMKKAIHFKMTTQSFPVGTQLTLVDAKSKKAYYYSATGSEDSLTGAEKYTDGGIAVPLSCFTDASGNSYQEPSISELIGASATTTGNTKMFVKVNANGQPENPEDGKSYPLPTVKIKNVNAAEGYDYYRLADTALGERGEYSITVDESKLKVSDTTGKIKTNVTENYYLVITVPKTDSSGNTQTTSAALNGSIQTIVTSMIPHQVHYRKLSGNTVKDREDKHENTASTYQLSNGYQQILSEIRNDGTIKRISLDQSEMLIDIMDAITFPHSQAYNDKDQLYLRFVNSLQRTMGSENGKPTEAEQFPSGTKGTVRFYVYTQNDNATTYYQYTNGSWSANNTGNSDQAYATEYEWESDGGNMELLLSTDGTDSGIISLQGLRNMLKNENSNASSSTFYVEVKMTVTLLATGLNAIPESKLISNEPEDYTKLTFSSQLSTEKQSLSYSKNRSSVTGTTAYYQEEPAGAQLVYDADDDSIGRLGINLLDLQDPGSNTADIYTTATYDISSLKNIEDTLRTSNGIKFTLSLSQKNSSNSLEAYDSELKNAGEYIAVELKSQNSGEIAYDENTGIWSWTVPKAAYYDTTNKALITSNIFNAVEKTLIQSIRLKVNVANVETSDHYYSNYRVVLTAEILDSKGETIKNTQKNDNIIYTLAKIKPEFMTWN